MHAVTQGVPVEYSWCAVVYTVSPAWILFTHRREYTRCFSTSTTSNLHHLVMTQTPCVNCIQLSRLELLMEYIGETPCEKKKHQISCTWPPGQVGKASTPAELAQNSGFLFFFNLGCAICLQWQLQFAPFWGRLLQQLLFQSANGTTTTSTSTTHCYNQQYRTGLNIKNHIKNHIKNVTFTIFFKNLWKMPPRGRKKQEHRPVTLRCLNCDRQYVGNYFHGGKITGRLNLHLYCTPICNDYYAKSKLIDEGTGKPILLTSIVNSDG